MKTNKQLKYYNVGVWDKWSLVQVDRFGVKAENKQKAKRKASLKVRNMIGSSVGYYIELEQINKSHYENLFN